MYCNGYLGLGQGRGWGQEKGGVIIFVGHCISKHLTTVLHYYCGMKMIQYISEKGIKMVQF